MKKILRGLLIVVLVFSTLSTTVLAAPVTDEDRQAALERWEISPGRPHPVPAGLRKYEKQCIMQIQEHNFSGEEDVPLGILSICRKKTLVGGMVLYVGGITVQGADVGWYYDQEFGYYREDGTTPVPPWLSTTKPTTAPAPEPTTKATTKATTTKTTTKKPAVTTTKAATKPAVDVTTKSTVGPNAVTRTTTTRNATARTTEIEDTTTTTTTKSTTPNIVDIVITNPTSPMLRVEVTGSTKSTRTDNTDKSDPVTTTETKPEVTLEKSNTVTEPAVGVIVADQETIPSNTVAEINDETVKDISTGESSTRTNVFWVVLIALIGAASLLTAGFYIKSKKTSETEL